MFFLRAQARETDEASASGNQLLSCPSWSCCDIHSYRCNNSECSHWLTIKTATNTKVTNRWKKKQQHHQQQAHQQQQLPEIITITKGCNCKQNARAIVKKREVQVNSISVFAAPRRKRKFHWRCLIWKISLARLKKCSLEKGGFLGGGVAVECGNQWWRRGGGELQCVFVYSTMYLSLCTQTKISQPSQLTFFTSYNKVKCDSLLSCNVIWKKKLDSA